MAAALLACYLVSLSAPRFPGAPWLNTSVLRDLLAAILLLTAIVLNSRARRVFGLLLPLTWYALAGGLTIGLGLFESLNLLRLSGGYILLIPVGVAAWDWLSPRKLAALAGALPILIAIRQATFGLSPEERFRLTDSGSTFDVNGFARLPGPFDTGQDLAHYVAVLTILLLFLSLQRPASIAAYIALGASLVVEVLVLQRAAVVGLAGAVAFLLYPHRPRSGSGAVSWARAARFLLALVALLSVASLVGGQRVQTAFDRLDPRQTGQLFSVDERREQIWPAAVDAWLEAPVYGNGPGAVGRHNLAPPGTYEASVEFTDNLFLTVAVQHGVVGLLLMIAPLALLAREATTHRRLSLALLIYISVAGSFGSFIGLASGTSLWALIYGMSVASTER